VVPLRLCNDVRCICFHFLWNCIFTCFWFRNWRNRDKWLICWCFTMYCNNVCNGSSCSTWIPGTEIGGLRFWHGMFKWTFQIYLGVSWFASILSNVWLKSLSSVTLLLPRILLSFSYSSDRKSCHAIRFFQCILFIFIATFWNISKVGWLNQICCSKSGKCNMNFAYPLLIPWS